MVRFDTMQAMDLTRNSSAAQAPGMTRTPLLLALVAAAALAGCDGQGQTIVAGPDGMEDPNATNDADLANVQLPPSIVASRTYRCKDNSLVYLDWLSNDTARLKKERAEVGTSLTKGEDGAYTAEGQRVTGDSKAASITVNGKSCKS